MSMPSSERLHKIVYVNSLYRPEPSRFVCSFVSAWFVCFCLEFAFCVLRYASICIPCACVVAFGLHPALKGPAAACIWNAPPLHVQHGADGNRRYTRRTRSLFSSVSRPRSLCTSNPHHRARRRLLLQPTHHTMQTSLQSNLTHRPPANQSSNPVKSTTAFPPPPAPRPAPSPSPPPPPPRAVPQSVHCHVHTAKQ